MTADELDVFVNELLEAEVKDNGQREDISLS